MENADLTYKGAVYPWHCDHMGHMNVMWYVGKFDEATWAFFTGLGLTPASMRDAGRGMAALEQHITYKREALAGDVLEIRSQLIEVKAKTLRFKHEMRNAASGDIAATTELLGIYMDTNARKATALPDTVRVLAESLLTG